jgi:mycofactocin precursor
MGATDKSTTTTTTADSMPTLEPPVQEDTLVEEISIDGMCGVY